MAARNPPSASAGEASPSLPASFAMGALAACIAEATTLPLDTAKVRLQLQSLAQDRSSRKYRGPLHTMATMSREEGVASLYKGLSPGIQRQFVFTGLRLGLYDKMKEVWGADHTLGRICAAVSTSAIGITFANPADLLKGIWAGLYQGFGANLLRNSTMSAAEIVSYESAKTFLIRTAGARDGVPVHIASGCYAGFVAALLGSPFDVIGTKVMQKRGPYAGSSLTTIIVKMVKDEGAASFYKGFWPNFTRIGSFNIVMWAAYEEIRQRMAPLT